MGAEVMSIWYAVTSGRHLENMQEASSLCSSGHVGSPCTWMCQGRPQAWIFRISYDAVVRSIISASAQTSKNGGPKETQKLTVIEALSQKEIKGENDQKETGRMIMGFSLSL